MSFKDHFSKHALDYAKYRPHYPQEMFAYLAGLCPTRETAWDCATGNGQAALSLTPFFAHLLATDASAQQIAQATAHPKIEYRVAPAEHTDIPAHAVALVTVAQALHWFHFEPFYAEVRRVLAPGGIVAVWCYNLLRCAPAIDKILDEYYRDVVGTFWPPERKFLEDRYQAIPFPFQEIDAPEFFMSATWNLDDLIGYVRTWSATQRFIAQKNSDPLIALRSRLLPPWGAPEQDRRLTWPLYLRVGRGSGEPA